MKSIRKINLIVLFGMFVFALKSQVSIGVKVGANFADTRVSGLVENFIPAQTTYTGFTTGIVAEIPMLNGFSFRPELNYIQKGFVTRQSFDIEILGIDMPLGAKAKTRVNYMEVPLLVKYSVGNEVAKAYVIAGPSIAYAASAELRPVATLLIDFNLPAININLNNDIYQRWEIGGTMGVGGEIKAGQGKIFADARYNLGFTNMLNNPIVDLKIKNQGMNISAGYAYTF